MTSEAERQAQEIVDRVSAAPLSAPQGYQVSDLTKLVNALIGNLKKDQELRKWAVELAAKTANNPENVAALANEIYSFASMETQKIIDKLETSSRAA